MGAFKRLETDLQELVEAHGADAVMRAANNLLNCHCNHCNHTWRPRISGRPDQCPRCKNRRWDKKRG